MQEREAQRQPLVRATPSLIHAKNPLCHNRPLAPIPARFAPFFLPLLTIPRIFISRRTGGAGPSPRPRERVRSRPAHSYLALFLTPYPPSYTRAILHPTLVRSSYHLRISSHPLHFATKMPAHTQRRPRRPARKVHGRIRALPAQSADDAEDRGGPAELRQRDAAGSQRAA